MSNEKMSEATRERLREKWEITYGNAALPPSLMTEEERKNSKPVSEAPERPFRDNKSDLSY
jgi:hypothetical protein